MQRFGRAGSALEACSRQLNAQVATTLDMVAPLHTVVSNTQLADACVCRSAVCALGCIAGIGPAHGRPRDWPDQRQLPTVQVSAYCCERPLVVVLIARLDTSAAHWSINATVHRACCCVWRQRLAYGAAIVRA
eukprot:1627123-Prymnesium_polylepis.1